MRRSHPELFSDLWPHLLAATIADRKRIAELEGIIDDLEGVIDDAESYLDYRSLPPLDIPLRLDEKAEAAQKERDELRAEVERLRALAPSSVVTGTDVETFDEHGSLLGEHTRWIEKAVRDFVEQESAELRAENDKLTSAGMDLEGRCHRKDALLREVLETVTCDRYCNSITDSLPCSCGTHPLKQKIRAELREKM